MFHHFEYCNHPYGCTAELLVKEAYTDDNGLLHLESGMNQSTMNKKGPFFMKNSNDEYSVNFDACKYAKGLDSSVWESSKLRFCSETNWDLSKIKDLHIFYTVDDPVVAPSSKTAEDYVAYSVEGTPHSYTLLGGFILTFTICISKLFLYLHRFY